MPILLDSFVPNVEIIMFIIQIPINALSVILKLMDAQNAIWVQVIKFCVHYVIVIIINPQIIDHAHIIL